MALGKYGKLASIAAVMVAAAAAVYLIPLPDSAGGDRVHPEVYGESGAVAPSAGRGECPYLAMAEKEEAGCSHNGTCPHHESFKSPDKASAKQECNPEKACSVAAGDLTGEIENTAQCPCGGDLGGLE